MTPRRMDFAEPHPRSVPFEGASPRVVRSEGAPVAALEGAAPAASVTRSSPVTRISEPPSQDSGASVRRSTRVRAPPTRLGYDGTQGHGYLAGVDLNEAFYQAPTEPQPWSAWNPDQVLAYVNQPYGYEYAIHRASPSDPDTLDWNRAMAELEHKDKWLTAASKEIMAMEGKDEIGRAHV